MTDKKYQIINDSSNYNCAKKTSENEGILKSTRNSTQNDKINEINIDQNSNNNNNLPLSKNIHKSTENNYIHLENKRNSDSATKSWLNSNLNKISSIKQNSELSKISIPMTQNKEDDVETRPYIEK
jgi:hypothetical protein